MTSFLGLSADQQALLSRLLKEQGLVSTEAAQNKKPPEAPIDPHQPFPLTDIQQAYWLGRSTRFAMGGVASHGYQEYHCGALDVDRFTAAWNQVIARHDMLRAVVGDDGMMRVLKDVPVYHVQVDDLRGGSDGEQQAYLDEIRAAQSHRVPDPAQWPLLDIRLTLLSDQRTRVHFSCDAIIADVYSVFLCLEELGILYRDPQTVLPSLNYRFRDYVTALKAEETGSDFAAAERYWMDRLPSLSPAPDLPVREDDRLQAPSFRRHTITFPAATWQAIKQRCLSLGLTPSLVLLTAYSEVLRVWSRKDAFTLNMTIFNRPPLHPDISRIVGDFTSTILLDVAASVGKDTFVERAKVLQEQFWTDFTHSAFSGVRVLRHLSQAQRGTASMPVVFTSALGTGDVGDVLDTGNSLLGRPHYSITQTPQVWIDHQVYEVDGGLGVNWDVVEGLFAPGVIEAMHAGYQDLLKRLACDDAVWHHPRPVLIPAEDLAERQSVNATACDLGADDLLHRPIFAQAMRTPERLALVAPDRSVSYGEMASLALGLAETLAPLCARRGEHVPLVAIALPKGWAQVVAVLAVHVAGAAYVPLDPDLPPVRRAAVLAEATPVAVITSDALATGDWSVLPPGSPLVRVDHCAPAAWPQALPEARQGAGDLAYVIFTSGSTGTPKGVMMDHRAVLNTVRDISQRYSVTAEDAVFALSSLSFDLSVYDIFGPLACGGHLVFPAAEETRDPQAWVRRLRQHPVTLWNSVPALWQMLVEYGEEIPPPRLALLSGDWIPLDLAQKSAALFATTTLVSLGGATEAAIWSIAGPVPMAPQVGWRSVPYGRPLSNQGFHVLRPDFTECPRHVAGQLFISGVGLAQGYWNDPAKTAAQFVVHPQSGDRLYRTGDMGRWREGGVIEFLGREDHQVKIGGHRVELGDIESALSRHPAVAHAVVDAVGTPPAPRRLAAFVVPLEGGEQPSAQSLRDHLASCLPAYMVPAFYALIPDLPLSANGKVDRRQLPAVKTQDTSDNSLPMTELEGVLAKVWCDVLGGGEVRKQDHFFEIGGNSLLAVRMVNILRDQYSLDLPLRTVFNEPGFTVMAKALTALGAPDGAVGGNPPVLCLAAGTTDGPPVICLGDVIGDTHAFSALAEGWHQGPALWAVSTRMDASLPPEQALTTTVERICAAICEQQPIGPVTLMGFSSGGLIAWDVAARLEQRGYCLDHLVLIDSQPIDLPQGGSLAFARDLLSAATGTCDAEMVPSLGHALAAVAVAQLPVHTVPVLLLTSQSTSDRAEDLANLWQQRCHAPVTRLAISGSHFKCLQSPMVEQWSMALWQILAVAQSDSPALSSSPAEASL